MGSIYDVTINAINSAAPADGFIDHKTSYRYMDESADAPDNIANALAKHRANIRYKSIILQISAMCNFRVTNVTTPGATADAPPTSITIRIEIEKSDDDVLIVEDENNLGTYLTGVDAIERCVARAMIQNKVVRGDYYDPTAEIGRATDGVADATGDPEGAVVFDQTVGALAVDLATAAAAITVTLVA